MTESFLGAMREFVLAEAQECYWQQAVLRESLNVVTRFVCSADHEDHRGNIQECTHRQTVDEGDL